MTGLTCIWPASDNTSTTGNDLRRTGVKRSLYDICVLLTKGQFPVILSQEFTMTTKTRVMNKIPTGVWKIHTIKLQTRSASKSNFNPWQDHVNEHKSENSSGSCNIKTTEQQGGFCSTSRVYVFLLDGILRGCQWQCGWFTQEK